MTRYFKTIIATSQLVIQIIAMRRLIFVLGMGQRLKILLEFYEDFFTDCGREPINPDGKKHRLRSIMKVVSGSLPEVANN